MIQSKLSDILVSMIQQVRWDLDELDGLEDAMDMIELSHKLSRKLMKLEEFVCENSEY